MSERVNLDAVRADALARVNRSERHFKIAFFAAVVTEALFLLTFLLLMDRHNRTHLLMLVATVGGYSVVVMGMTALGAYVNRSVLRVLKAVELLKG